MTEAKYVKIGNKKIVNCTPHAINLIKGDEIIQFPPSGYIARVSTEEEEFNYSELGFELPVKAVNFGEVEGLPLEPLAYELVNKGEDTFYIVSSIVQQALIAYGYREKMFDYRKILSPHDFVRDSQGNILGCKSFKVG